MAPIFETGTYIDQALFLSPVHLYTLTFFFILISFFYLFRDHSLVIRFSRWTLIGVLAVSEISLIVWSLSIGQWDIRFNLPLQLCTISLYLCIIMLITRNYFIFEVVYFFGIAGSFQALVTPDLFYTFPHYRYLHFFVAHFAIILAILHMVWIEKYTITFTSIFKSFAVLNGFAFIAFSANKVTGANYMFLARKPTGPSILDVLGPYPWYIVSLEFIALLMFVLLYLPFHKKKQK
ncbi:YwaF family protein [Alkalihalobacillus deserti]|uniref:YwaF family protein n=1 Tax=Alkalihalobacillus deserti TaxID=2879466 RepID=UPI001D13C95A|nr:TIGR02206 family membrane protein [Alkalihalobacillus deserti]